MRLYFSIPVHASLIIVRSAIGITIDGGTGGRVVGGIVKLSGDTLFAEGGDVGSLT